MRISLLFFTLIFISACGVKGDPLPPERPVELGRGRPTYRRATEGIRIERKVRSNEKDDEEEQEDKDSDEN